MLMAALCGLFAFVGIVFAASAHAQADEDMPAGSRLITLHDRGVDQVFVTKAATLGEALKEAGVELDPRDTVEPGLDEELVASEYNVNIYRARPMIVVDGTSRQKIMTSAQTPGQIAESADITLYDEDIAEIQRSENILVDGAALQVVITRATPFELTLYGETMQVRTQADTVSEFLEEKGIELGNNDRMSASNDTKITKDLKLRIWREGKQTITVDEAIDFEVEQIRDANREVGYKSVRTPGVKGEASVTYEVTIRDGKEVSRKKIASVTKKQPKKQVEIVGSKPSVTPYTGGGSKDEWLTAAGIPREHWGAADAIISQESGWNPNAINPSSGACGLAQALPCSKVPGNPLDPVDSLRWMNGYVNGRYGGWQQALAFKQANGWY